MAYYRATPKTHKFRKRVLTAPSLLRSQTLRDDCANVYINSGLGENKIIKLIV